MVKENPTFVETGLNRARKIFPKIKSMLIGLKQLSLDYTPKIKSRETQNEERAFIGLKLSDGTLLFDSPKSRLMEQASADDQRIMYFRFQIPEQSFKKFEPGDSWPSALKEAPANEVVILDVSGDIISAMHRSWNRLSATENLFLDLAVEPLTTYLAENLADYERVGIRGTACTLNIEGEVVVDGITIKPIQQIIRDGGENDKNSVGVTGFEPRSPKIASRSVQWLMQHPKELRERATEAGDERAAQDIFPVLLVYDLSKFIGQGVGRQTQLPKDPELRAQCIIKAIVLDMPLPYSTVDSLN